jgi:hypothetical protein
MKEYTVSDLFFNQWQELTGQVHSEVHALQQHIQTLQKESVEYGYTLIQILRRLRKNFRLVNKIDEAQAVDIYNDLAFLHAPWYYFPHLENKALALVRPDEKMARSSFDEFIYADNEFSMFIINQDEKHLRRLIVTLYPLLGDAYFDPETVEQRAAALEGKLKQWQLNQVFFTFAHIRDHVMTRCKALLPKPVKIIGQDPEPPVATGPMWYRIKHNAARTLVFGSFEQTGRANMYSVLDHLEILCQEAANAKSKTK